MEPILSKQEGEDLQFCIEHFDEVPEERKIFVLQCLMLAHEAKRGRQRLEDGA